MRYIKDNQYVGIRRKCGCCEEYFYISHNDIDDAIYYDKKTYHSSCFINMCNKRSQMKREDVSQKWTWVLNHLDQIRKESYQHLSLAITKENVFEFIKDSYDVTIVPTTVWQKLSDIYNGTFKGMSVGIPPEHLLDMWKRKIDMLNGIADRNRTKGLVMSSDKRISYDLSILVNKYDSYLRWLEKQKIIEAEKEIEKSENIVGKSIGYTSNKPEKNDPDDISALVDDIFG